MLDKVPPEVLRAIIDQVNCKDLLSLCKVSRKVYYWAHIRLYEIIDIGTPDEWCLGNLNEAPILQRLIAFPKCAKHVKRIQIGLKLYDNIQERCFHNRQVHDFDALVELAHALLPLFHQLTDNTLKSFHWNLGTCVPKELLGSSGYLTRHQNQITSLSLVTDPVCRFYNDDGLAPRLELSKFKSLRTFSWRGLRSMNESSVLHDVLKNNSRDLKELELDFFYWDSVRMNFNHSAKRSVKLLDFSFFEGLNPASPRYPHSDTPGAELDLQSLRALSLSGYSFTRWRTFPTLPETMLAFNFSNLRSLTLKRCRYIRRLFKLVVDLNLPIRLTSLKIKENELEDLSGDCSSIDPLPVFLQSFRGLQTLHLFIWPIVPYSAVLWDSILHHGSTLKELIHHEQNSHYEDDVRGLPWGTMQGTPATMGGTISSFKLEYVGLCCSFSQLRSSLGPLTLSQTLRVLHVRAAGPIILDVNWAPIEQPEVEDFAQWVFGPDGLPNLQVLAYHDFSYGKRNMIYCRAPNPAAITPGTPGLRYRSMRDADWDRMDDAEAAELIDMLETVPEEYFF